MKKKSIDRIRAIWSTLTSQKQNPLAFQRNADKPFTRWITDYEQKTYSPEGNIYRPEDFGYHINSEGLRCDELEPSDTDDLRIVFTGCSITFGVGLPGEHTYAHKLVTRLRNEGLNVPHWNLAFGSTSIEYSVRSLYQFLPRLKPDIVIAYFPHAGRWECFAEYASNPNMALINFIPNWHVSHWKTRLIDGFFNEENEAYKTAAYYAFFETLMTAHGCDYRWDNWMLPAQLTDQQEASIPPSMMDRRLIFDRKKLMAKPLARDRTHWGPMAHVHISDTIYDSIPDMIARGHERRAIREAAEGTI